MPRTVSENEKAARQVFASADCRTPEELCDLAQRVRDEDNNLEYSYRLLLLASNKLEGASQEVSYRVQRDLALCTYKNPDQPPDRRLKEAESIGLKLLSDPALTPAQRQDTLAIMGAIWKQRWRIYGLREHLEKAVLYYRQGMAIGMDLDKGHTAINAAFVLDLLAAAGSDTTGKASLQQEARQIREGVRDMLLHILEPGSNHRSDFWLAATLGEALLGLGSFQEAEAWMREAGTQKPAPWKFESTVRQIARLASLIASENHVRPDSLDSSPPWRVVKALTGDEYSATSFLLGKVGLALSGGGFRASLFHIGVLARLAELDMLRHVEVLSCVSGGSIVGAFYYLELRKKLQEKAALDQADYIQVVENVEHKFLKGVQRNIRLRMLMGFRTNLRVLTRRNSSMTERLAILYDRELYDLVEDEFQGKRRSLSDILITPKDSPAHFRPKYDNWERRDKVPILILNATTLNTCHNWQFTGSYMGEPPARGIQTDIDANDRLRRMYHEDAPPEYRKKNGTAKSRIKLSEAVAASAGVPALFDPLALDDLYGTTYDPTRPTHYVTRLVDGGAYDNQGVTSLLEQDCTVLLVSDASGQTGLAVDPGGSRLEVIQRSNNILMSRVREAQYQYLAALRDVGVIHGLMYVHLKKGLESTPVDWMDCPDPALREPIPVLTSYGMRRDIQLLLARIRTDLDSFSDCEADALMLSGYLMTKSEFEVCMQHFPVKRGVAHPWRFRKISAIATDCVASTQTEELRKALAIAAGIWLKPWKTSPVLKAITFGWAALLLACLGFFCWYAWALPVARTPLASAWIGKTLVLIGAAVAFLSLLRIVLDKAVKYHNSYGQILVSVFMCLVGWLFLRLHLHIAEPWYLRYGPRYRDPEMPPDTVSYPGRAEPFECGFQRSQSPESVVPSMHPEDSSSEP